MKMMKKIKNESAYTLLEVMVALIIIGISLTAVTGGLAASKRVSAKADHVVEAVRILKNLFVDTRFISEVIEDEGYDGMLPIEEGWHCKVLVEPLNVVILEVEGEERSLSRSDSSDEIDVPGMVEVKVCISDKESIIKKEYCITRWERAVP